MFVYLLNTRVKHHIASSLEMVSNCHLPSDGQIFESYLTQLLYNFWFRTSQKSKKNCCLLYKKKPFPQFKSFMIKDSFDVVRIMSSGHLRLCPKGGKFENIALNLGAGGGAKEIVSTFELD